MVARGQGARPTAAMAYAMEPPMKRQKYGRSPCRYQTTGRGAKVIPRTGCSLVGAI